MKALSIFFLVACLLVFARARSRFFKRSAGEDPGRKALARLGTIAGVLLPVNAIYPMGLTIPPQYELGIFSFLASFCLFYFSTRAHGSERPGIAYTLRAPSSLVYSGPYRFVRHPIYTAYILCWIGASLIGPTVGALLLTCAITYLYYKTVIFEEAVIEGSDLALEYQRYKEKTGMFVPRLRVPRVR